MVYQTLTGNMTSLSELMIYISTNVPIFFPIALVSLFIIVTLGSFYSQARLRGEGDFWSSLTVAGLLCSVVSIILGFIPNLINIFVIIGFIVVTIVGAIIMFLTE